MSNNIPIIAKRGDILMGYCMEKVFNARMKNDLPSIKRHEFMLKLIKNADASIFYQPFEKFTIEINNSNEVLAIRRMSLVMAFEKGEISATVKSLYLARIQKVFNMLIASLSRTKFPIKVNLLNEYQPLMLH